MRTFKENVVFSNKRKVFLAGIGSVGLALFFLFFLDIHDSKAEESYLKQSLNEETLITQSAQLGNSFMTMTPFFDERSLSKSQNVFFALEETNDQQQAPQKKKELRPIHKGSTQQQEYIDYAWDQHHDKNFIYLLKAENGLITPDRMHNYAYYCKKRIAHDWGFGGISDCYHNEITSDPRFFTDWKWQMDKVYELYRSGTKFSSRSRWKGQSKYFTWVYL